MPPDPNSGPQIATTRDLKQALKRLRDAFPMDTPVVVRMDLPAGHEDFGICDLIEEPRRYFLIRLQKGMTKHELLDTLLHEWAHVVDWRPDFPFRCDHGPSWGVSYAEVYCEFFGVS